MIFYAGDLLGNVSGLRNLEIPQRKTNIRSTIITHFPVKAIITVEKSPNVSDSIALVHCSRLRAYENLWDQLKTESLDFVFFKKRWGDNLDDLDSTQSCQLPNWSEGFLGTQIGPLWWFPVNIRALWMRCGDSGLECWIP